MQILGSVQLLAALDGRLDVLLQGLDVLVATVLHGGPGLRPGYEAEQEVDEGEDAERVDHGGDEVARAVRREVQRFRSDASADSEMIMFNFLSKDLR